MRPEIVPTEQRYAYDQLHIAYAPERGLAEVPAAIGSFEDENRDQLSVPLAVNLMLLKDWLGGRPQNLKWLHPR